jgi:hypothetical protein
LQEVLTTDTPEVFDPFSEKNKIDYKKMDLKRHHTRKRHFHGRFFDEELAYNEDLYIYIPHEPETSNIILFELILL